MKPDTHTEARCDREYDSVRTRLAVLEGVAEASGEVIAELGRLRSAPQHSRRQKSTGHLAFHNEEEWLTVRAELYRAPINAPLIDGSRIGRWECSMEHAQNYSVLFPFLIPSDT